MSDDGYQYVTESQRSLVARFGQYLTNTGGNEPLDLLNDLADPSQKHMAATNMVRFTLAVAVQSQLSLIAGLIKAGLLEQDAWRVMGIANGVEMIAAERSRQQAVEGYTTSGDVYRVNELRLAAAAYALPPALRRRSLWPWTLKYWKPTTDLRDLVKAGALIAAAIDALLAGQEVGE